MGKRDQDKVRAERARDVGLFRYALIREAASLSGRERGAMVRELAAVEHRGPDGRMVKVSRATLDRWIADWKRRALLTDPWVISDLGGRVGGRRG